MNENLFVVLIGTFGFAGSCIGLFKDYRDRRYTKKWWKQIKAPGIVLAIIALCILVLGVWQFIFTKQKAEKEKELDKVELAKRDSMIKSEISRGVDSNRKLLFADLSQALRKQELRLDTVNKELVTIKDSVGNNQRNLTQPVPVVEISRDGITIRKQTDTSLSYQLEVSVFGAGATNFKIRKYFHFVFNEDVALTYPAEILLEENAKIAADHSLSRGSEIFFDKKYKLKELKFYIVGTFTSLDGRVKSSIDEIYVYNLDTKITAILAEPYKTKNRKIILSALPD